jgi:hypothetical protein
MHVVAPPEQIPEGGSLAILNFTWTSILLEQQVTAMYVALWVLAAVSFLGVFIGLLPPAHVQLIAHRMVPSVR